MPREVIGECKLCGRILPLIESHIIPKSIINWVKDISATGFLRSSSSPEKRKQDGVKAHLMCSLCDGNLIGLSEKKFMESIFRPYQKDRNITIHYDKNLHYFVASLSFRIILYEEFRQEHREGVNFAHFEKPKKYLKRYLRGLVTKSDGLEHYIILTGKSSDIITPRKTDESYIIQYRLPRGMEFYLARTLDSVAFELNDHLITFAQIPGFIFITVLRPKKYRGNLGHRINVEGGEISFPSSNLIGSDIFGFLLERSQEIGSKTISVEQSKKISKFVANNPERWNNSETKKYITSLSKK